MKKTKLTVAIPTRNRLPFLRHTLEHMLSIREPEDLEVTFAVSATSCDDLTPAYLDALSRNEARISVNTRQTRWTRWNYIHLEKVVPSEAEWVWLFGDDDIIIDKHGWDRVSKIISMANSNDASLICIPQAKRVLEPEAIHADTLINLCYRFGMHEAMGWITSLIMRRDVFVGFIDAMRIRFSRARTDTGLNRSRVTPFFHSLELFKHHRNNVAILCLLKIVDEQIPPTDKKAHTAQSRTNEHLRHRLIYTFTEYLDILRSDARSRSIQFYRYVNKTFPDLMLNIIAEDLLMGVSRNTAQASIDQLRSLIEFIEIHPNSRPFSEMLKVIEEIFQRNEEISPTNRLALEKIFERTKTPYLGEFVTEYDE